MKKNNDIYAEVGFTFSTRTVRKQDQHVVIEAGFFCVYTDVRGQPMKLAITLSAASTHTLKQGACQSIYV